MAILVSLSTPDFDDESLQEFTRQMCRDLRNEAGLEASLATERAESGTKSGTELEIIGQILIKAVGAGGAIVALVNVLKTYAARKSSLHVKIRCKSGKIVEINADDLGTKEMSLLVQTIEQAFAFREDAQDQS
jgi:hypothetical protein